MKIMAIVPTLSDGGAERVMSILTGEWAKSHQVVVVLFDASNPAYAHGGRMVDLRLPASRSFFRSISRIYITLRRALRLVGLMRRERPDRIISFMENANFPAIVAATLAGLRGRLYVSVRSVPSMLSFEFRILIPWLYRLPARVVAVSRGVKRELESIGVPATRTTVIYNPIRVADWRMQEHESASPPLPGRFVLGVGRLHFEKGFERLLTAFHALGRPDIALVILGEGEERSMLVNFARELGVENRVHFIGWTADVDIWYRHAECLVMSSRHEGWPNVIMEALENGCPIVSFDCKYGPREIIEDGKYGLLVAEGDVDGLTKSIARILDDATFQRNLAVKGMERVKVFDVERIAARWLYEEHGSNQDERA